MFYRNKISVILIGFSISLLSFSCKKFIAIDLPGTSLVSVSVFESEATATAAVKGIYSKMIESGYGFSSGAQSISLLTGLSSDELLDYSFNDDEIQFYSNTLTENNGIIHIVWSELYSRIYAANAILEGLEKTTALSASLKNQLSGEAKFIRAFCYFYLTSLYNDVPLVTTTDYRTNAVLARTSRSGIYEAMISDLKDAQESLPDNYAISGGDRTRPNRWAAGALLARVYLYSEDWVHAEAEATAIIEHTDLFNLETDLDNVFLKNSHEAIWQLHPVLSGYNTFDADVFVLLYGPNSYYNTVSLSEPLVNAFELNDHRKTKWVSSYTDDVQTYYYPNKYKVVGDGSPVTEYLMMLRLAEQYLIRAEARAWLDNIAGSTADLNRIRTRSGMPGTTAVTQSELFDAIQHERQTELFTEWGHRWLDLKRTHTLDAVMTIITPQKGGVWNANWQWYPVPQSERANNLQLSQNSGY